MLIASCAISLDDANFYHMLASTDLFRVADSRPGSKSKVRRFSVEMEFQSIRIEPILSGVKLSDCTREDGTRWRKRLCLVVVIADDAH
jgi:hypothetical protein